jgi:deazaflavin-dependent oxidoreductase (nitroreductase family)
VRLTVNLPRGRDSALRGRRLTTYEQTVERVAASPAGTWALVHGLDAVDRRLLALTGARVSVAPGAPVGLLETTGARTGRRRRTPVLYLIDGDAVVLIASNGGRARHPAWFHNLRARASVRMLTRERGWCEYRARVAAGTERSTRWALATDLFTGYGRYEALAAGREIPVVVLEPAQRGIEMPPAT